MVILKDLEEDWITARSVLKQQIKMLEDDPTYPQAGLSDDVRKAIVTHIKKAVVEYDALLKENPNA
jgi:hypothetical protein